MKTLRVLVVEDSDSDAGLIETALGEIPASILPTRAATLAEAFNAIADSSFDAILLSLKLGGGVPISTLTRVLRTAREVPVVALVECEDAPLALSAIREGAQEVVAKTTLEPISLATAIRHSIERSRIVHDLRRTAFVDSFTGLLTRFGLQQMAGRPPVQAAIRSIVCVRLAGAVRVAEVQGQLEIDSLILEMADTLRWSAPDGALLGRTAEAEVSILSAVDANTLFASLAPAVNEINKQVRRRTDGPPMKCLFGAASVIEGQTLEIALENAGRAMCENGIAFAAGA